MKLLELTLNDFRQFYGKQKIQFSKDEQNITVVLGENGNGKTGIFRAIVFCLFNEKILPKDKEDKSFAQNKIHLVNLNRLKENVNQPVEASVELIFENRGSKYTLIRNVYDRIDSKGNVESDLEVDVKLTIQDVSGNVVLPVLSKETDVKRVIDDIINERIKDLFFFDGDKIEALSTTNEASREEIRNGIMKLLQIDSIKRAIEIMDKLKKEQKSKIKSNANTKLQAEEDAVDKLSIEVDECKEEFDLKKSQLEKVISEIAELETKQEENEAIKDLFAQRNNIRESKNKTNTILSGIKLNIKDILCKGGNSLLIEDTLYKSRNYIEQEEKDKGFHSGITVDLLDQILSSKECICGNRFDEENIAYLKLQDLKNKHNKMQLSDFIRDFKRNVSSSLDFGEDMDIKLQRLLAEHNDNMNELENLQKKLEGINAQKNEFSQTEDKLNGLENSLNKCKTDAQVYTRELAVLENKLERLNKDISGKEENLRLLRKEDEKLKQDNSKLEHYEQLCNLFIGIRDSYSSKMRSRLSSESTDIFNMLIAEKDKKIISQIIINEQYEIQARGWNDVSIFRDISSGQKQMLSLAFVSALARVASGDNSVIDMPLFMDTPFAKLDGNNRDSLITAMPALTSQWILLVTDTEFARSEVKKMKETGKWGVFYKLIKIKDGYTQIEHITDINDFVSSR